METMCGDKGRLRRVQTPHEPPALNKTYYKHDCTCTSTDSRRATRVRAGAQRNITTMPFNPVIKKKEKKENKWLHPLWQANVLCFTALCPAGPSFSVMHLFFVCLFFLFFLSTSYISLSECWELCETERACWQESLKARSVLTPRKENPKVI